jgi:hypothetical protein
VFDLELVGQSLYLGGFFIHAGGQTRYNCAKLSAVYGYADPAFVADTNNRVYSIAYDGANLYLAGTFSMVGSFMRQYVARVNGNTGALDGFNSGIPNMINTQVNSIIYDGTYIYVAGLFYFSGSYWKNVIKIDPASSTQVPGFNIVSENAASVVAYDGANIFVGGIFRTIGGLWRQHLVKLDAVSGIIDVGFDPEPDGAVKALAYNGNDLYAGGNFIHMGLNAVIGLAKVDAMTGVNDNSFSAVPSSQVLSLLYHQGSLYTGGEFTTMNSQAIKYAAKLDPATGAVDTAFNPSPNNRVLSLLGDGTNIYLGGSFTKIGADSCTITAKVNAATGALDTAFAPKINGVHLYAMAMNGNDLYGCGSFISVSGTPRSCAAKLDKITGALDASYKPNAGDYVQDCALYGQSIFLGGNFTNIYSVPRNYLGQAACSDGFPYSGFDPSPDGRIVTMALSQTHGILYVGGYFNNIDGKPVNNYAAIYLGPSPAAQTPTFTITVSATRTITRTRTPTSTASPTRTATATRTLTGSATDTPDISPTVTSTVDLTAATPSLTQTPTCTVTVTQTYSQPAYTDLLIYPNPANSIAMFVLTDQADADNIEISVYTVAFRLIIRQGMAVNSQKKYSVDVSGLANGVYYARIRQLKDGREISGCARPMSVIR